MGRMVSGNVSGVLVVCLIPRSCATSIALQMQFASLAMGPSTTSLLDFESCFPDARCWRSAVELWPLKLLPSIAFSQRGPLVRSAMHHLPVLRFLAHARNAPANTLSPCFDRRTPERRSSTQRQNCARPRSSDWSRPAGHAARTEQGPNNVWWICLIFDWARVQGVGSGNAGNDAQH
ncbi:hypothetical protein BKA81DRAFT_383510 [Phyllosticta paracitricarpa]